MKKFSRVYVEITNICNLSCSFCVGNSRELRIMSKDEFIHILKEIKPFTDHVYFHVLGEPLSHPLLADFLDIASDFKMKVNITTNGTLLNKKQDILLNAKSLRKVSVSLHSLETDDEKVRKDYIKNVADFANKSMEKGKICELRLWNLGADGIHNEDIFTPLCEHLGIDNGAKQEAKTKINQLGCTTLMPRLFLGKAERFQWPSMNAPLTNKDIFCFGLRNHVAILCDGTVVPCCLDGNGDVNLGNVFTTSFEDILNSERATNLYNGFSNRAPSEELCKRCGYATRF